MIRNWYRMNELILYSGVSSSRLVLTIPLKKKNSFDSSSKQLRIEKSQKPFMIYRYQIEMLDINKLYVSSTILFSSDNINRMMMICIIHMGCNKSCTPELRKSDLILGIYLINILTKDYILMSKQVTRTVIKTYH